jgi:hypothetical protein
MKGIDVRSRLCGRVGSDLPLSSAKENFVRIDPFPCGIRTRANRHSSGWGLHFLGEVPCQVCPVPGYAPPQASGLRSQTVLIPCGSCRTFPIPRSTYDPLRSFPKAAVIQVVPPRSDNTANRVQKVEGFRPTLFLRHQQVASVASSSQIG